MDVLARNLSWILLHTFYKRTKIKTIYLFENKQKVRKKDSRDDTVQTLLSRRSLQDWYLFRTLSKFKLIMPHTFI